MATYKFLSRFKEFEGE